MKRLFTFLSRANNNSVGIHLFNHRRVSTIYSMLTLVAILLMVPSAVRGATYNFDWHWWYNGATGAYLYDSGTDTNCSGTIVLSDNNYADIEGAKTVTRVQYRLLNTSTGNYGTGKQEISERLAFVVNTEGKGNEYNGNNGWYLRAEPNPNQAGKYIHAGLYTGCWNSKLAILSLRGGDKVTFTFEAGDHASEWGAGIHYNQSVHCHRGDNNDVYDQNAYFESGQTIYITSSGDLIIDANIGTYITGIKIETADVAKYTITTDGNKTTFTFTGDGVLEDNDFTLPNLSASFGSINDNLVVSGLESHMIKFDGTETLDTDPATNFQPSAGSFYAFKPTASGTIHVDGTLLNTANQTAVIHVFVYNPNLGTIGDWDERANGKFYRDTFYGNSFDFTVVPGKTYYICIDNGETTGERANVFHLHSFSFTTDFYVKDLGVVINDVDDITDNGKYSIAITQVDPAGGYELKVKRCSGNISPAMEAVIQNGWLYMSKPSFTEGTDHAGTVIWDLVSDGGSAAIVVTFPYSAGYKPAGYTDPTAPDRTYGHTWNFIDPRNSDSNIGNCMIRTGLASFSPGTTTGILSIGQNKDANSQFHAEVAKREWIYAQRQTGSSGGFHDPMYKNVWDMVGDNADMIWETEGLIFETGPNLSCLYNENDAVDQSLTNPLDFKSPGSTDPDRYVGLMPPVQSTDFSSFTIPGLKDGDRVLIFMKSGEGSGDNGIFLNITGAKDALGKQITSAYKAGGTNWQHSRYEGCYHFIKDGNGDMKFTMTGGSMAKLLYIRIYQGQRINTNSIVSTGNKQDENGDDVLIYDEEKEEYVTIQDAGRILFMNDKGAAKGQYSNMSLRFRGKGQNQKAEVLTSSGNLNYTLANNNAATDSHFTIGGKYNQAVGFTSQVGEIGVFRMREMDMEYGLDYVADFCDRNFTVGYRDKVDSYPYTWDFTDIMKTGTLGSKAAMDAEASNYPISAASSDEYGNQWDISLFDASGNMKLNTGFDPIENNEIFAPHKIGNGNQLWAGNGAIPEARGLWFYSEDDEEDGYTTDYSSSLYNDCLQITSDGIRFANTPDADGKRVAWWNYKMVVPDVPEDGAVYMRMKRDTSVPDDAVTYSSIAQGNVPFLAARFQFASQGSKTDMVTGGEIMNGDSYSFFQVPGETDEWIVAVKNTTGAVNHLTFTLNGWIVKKVAISEDAKTLNKKGYASESRGRVIDHSLTSFFTGKPIKAYTAENYVASGDKGTIDLKEITKPMPAATADGQTVGSVLYNSDNKDAENKDCGKIEVLNDGFHLFVPDMHDYTGDPNDATNMKTSELQSTSNNWMKSYNVGGASNTTITQKGSDGVRYVLSYQYYDHDKDDQTLNDAEEEAFYRVAKGGALIKPNSAYISFPTTSSAKVSFLFEDELFGQSQGITTGITEAPQQNVKAEWYSLDGRKLNGAPTEKGLYIINGKKVLVK